MVVVCAGASLFRFPKEAEESASQEELLGFAVSRMLLAEGAVFHQLNPVRSILLVFHVVVVALFALCTSQANLVACGVCHFGHLLT